MNPRTIQRLLAITLLLSAASLTGCNRQNVRHDPEVDWTTPSSSAGDVSHVADAPGLGACDTLGHAIFVRHDARFAQAQAAALASVLTAADRPTLDFTDLATLDPRLELFAFAHPITPGPVRFD